MEQTSRHTEEIYVEKDRTGSRLPNLKQERMKTSEECYDDFYAGEAFILQGRLIAPFFVCRFCSYSRLLVRIQDSFV